MLIGQYLKIEIYYFAKGLKYWAANTCIMVQIYCLILSVVQSKV